MPAMAPANHSQTMSVQTTITPQAAGSLPGLFLARVQATPDASAYRHFDPAQARWMDTSWADMRQQAGHWQAALMQEGLERGERVAIMLRNGIHWVLADQASLALGLVDVPVFFDDRADNAAYVIAHSKARVLFVQNRKRWRALATADALDTVKRVIIVSEAQSENEADSRIMSLTSWLAAAAPQPFRIASIEPRSLASIVYTSGTTGRPKGVMLSHANILANAYAASRCAQFDPGELFLSFLPLSHMLERTAGYYLPMMTGGMVAYSRSIPQLSGELRTLKPQVLISVPRIYERMYAQIQDALKNSSGVERWLFHLAVAVGWRRFLYAQRRSFWGPDLWLWPLLERRVASRLLDNLGGRLKFAISGGAALPPQVSHLFLAFGAPIYQGYGMTEASPVVAVNRPHDNVPDSVGRALEGVNVKLGEQDELLVSGANVMLGYWENPEATGETIDRHGWLHTGDQARIDDEGHVFIVGRLKEILVLSNGEKVSSADIEKAVLEDPLIDQAVVIGDGRPYLSALLVINGERLAELATQLKLDPASEETLSDSRMEQAVLTSIGARLKGFPGYAKLRRITLLGKSWTIEEGLLTPTLKPRRAEILKRYDAAVRQLYRGHGT
jgi:long-chain acyl-CoA synthetase